MKISKRIDSLSESQTLQIAARCQQLRAEGVDVIGLSLGEPDFAAPQHVKAIDFMERRPALVSSILRLPTFSTILLAEPVHVITVRSAFSETVPVLGVRFANSSGWSVVIAMERKAYTEDSIVSIPFA